ncbi:MAG: hypothetical protein EXR75_01830 [Myxococcales bacterium]|nr:hypothetical protein [Myxococcales bacterium]
MNSFRALHTSTLGFFACFIGLAWGCGDATTSAGGSSDAATTSAAGGSDGSGGNSTTVTTANAGGGAATATSGQGGGAPLCGQGMIDNACEKCAAAKCTAEAKGCAMASECDDAGMVTGGCLALVNCAATKCGGSDLGCILVMCSEELKSAGGPNGAGGVAAKALGECVTKSCATECAMP